MKIFTILSIIGFSFNLFATEELFQPIQYGVDQDLEMNMKGMKANVTDDLIPIDKIHVKIFPHDGKYTAPARAELRTDQVKIKSEGTCILTYLNDETKNIELTEAVVKAEDFTSDFGHLQCDKPLTIIREGAQAITYRGSFNFYNNEGKLLIVNNVTLRQYLKGVIPAEVYPSWPLETLKAQAVAARTYALYQVREARRKKKNKQYDIDDTVMYQAYLGTNREHPSTSKAVEETENISLTDDEGKDIIAYFSADSGGYTETAINVWQGSDLSYTPSKPEVYDLTLVKSEWSVDFSLAEIEARLLKRKIISQDFKLAQFEIAKYTISGRIKKVILTSLDGRQLNVHGESFRYGLSLRSSLFIINQSDDGRFHLDGRGHGHGVGMNQFGAKVLAKEMGWDFKQILSFYYEGVNI